jgi:hypothetical protein
MHKLVQSLSGMIRDPANRVRQPRARIDVVEYRGRDQRIHRVRPLSALPQVNRLRRIDRLQHV